MRNCSNAIQLLALPTVDVHQPGKQHRMEDELQLGLMDPERSTHMMEAVHHMVQETELQLGQLAERLLLMAVVTPSPLALKLLHMVVILGAPRLLLINLPVVITIAAVLVVAHGQVTFPHLTMLQPPAPVLQLLHLVLSMLLHQLPTPLLPPALSTHLLPQLDGVAGVTVPQLLLHRPPQHQAPVVVITVLLHLLAMVVFLRRLAHGVALALMTTSPGMLTRTN